MYGLRIISRRPGRRHWARYRAGGRLLRKRRRLAMGLLVLLLALAVLFVIAITRDRGTTEDNLPGLCYLPQAPPDWWQVADRFIAAKQPRFTAARRLEIISAVWAATMLEIWTDERARARFERPSQAFGLLIAQGAAESGCNPDAVRMVNGRPVDLGWGQINRANLNWLGISDWRDVRQNARGQARYMADLLAGLGHRGLHYVVAGYNAGGGKVASRGIPNNGITPRYVNRVMANYRALRAGLIKSGKPVYETRYVVKRGDTLWAIARRFGTTVARIAERNGIADPDLIHIGQDLII